MYLHQRDWCFIGKQPASAPHLAHPDGCAALRFVPFTVPHVSPPHLSGTPLPSQEAATCQKRSNNRFKNDPPPSALWRGSTVPSSTNRTQHTATSLLSTKIKTLRGASVTSSETETKSVFSGTGPELAPAGASWYKSRHLKKMIRSSYEG